MAEAAISRPAGTEWIESGRKAASKEYHLKWLVGIWMAVVFYWPVMNVAGMDFRGDYPFALIMAVWLGLQRWGRATRIMLFILLVYSILLLIGTINGILLGYPFNIAAFIGFLKFFLIAVVWAELLRKIRPSFIIRLIPVLALPAAIFALLQIAVPGLVDTITIEFYSSAARTPTERLFGEAGRFSRAVSVFESPVYLGLGSLLFLVFAWASYENERGMRGAAIYFILMIIYALAGLASGSSTFLCGVGIVLVMIIFRALMKANIKKWVGFLITGIAGAIFIAFYWAAIASEAAKSQFRYQMNKIMSGEVLASRLGPEGNLWEAISHWPEFILTGMGAVNPPYFTGDSLYVGTLSRIGLIGLMFVLALFITGCVQASKRWKDPGTYAVMLGIIIILAAGLASPTLMKPRLLEVVTFILVSSLFYLPFATRHLNLR